LTTAHTVELFATTGFSLKNTNGDITLSAGIDNGSSPLSLTTTSGNISLNGFNLSDNLVGGTLTLTAGGGSVATTSGSITYSGSVVISSGGPLTLSQPSQITLQGASTLTFVATPASLSVIASSGGLTTAGNIDMGTGSIDVEAQGGSNVTLGG